MRILISGMAIFSLVLVWGTFVLSGHSLNEKNQKSKTANISAEYQIDGRRFIEFIPEGAPHVLCVESHLGLVCFPKDSRHSVEKKIQ